LFGSGGKKGMDSDGKGLGMGAKLQPAGSYNTKCAGYCSTVPCLHNQYPIFFIQKQCNSYSNYIGNILLC
jgi:hypothetical protein